MLMPLAIRIESTTRVRSSIHLLVAAALLISGCASSGDVEKIRQEQAQAKAKIRTELQQERDLAASMAKESEAQQASADKLMKALGGGAAGNSPVPARLHASSMSLTAALQNAGCLSTLPAQPPNPQVQVLAIGGTIQPGGGSSPCTSVTVSATDATFTGQAPLMPVVIGAGGTLTIQDQTMTLYASSFLIQNGGTMQAGTATAPVQNAITIVMAGNSSAALPPTHGDLNPNARDITVMDGGVLALYGGKGLSAAPDGTHNDPATNPAFINTVSGTKSWTYLAIPAGPTKYNDAENVSAPVPTTAPDTTLTLATTVDWQVNDWVAVATTSFSSHQTEIVQICAIATVPNPDSYTDPRLPWNHVVLGPGESPTVSQLTLCPATRLKHYHYGGLAPTPGFFPANTTQSVVTGGNPINVSHQAKSFYDDHRRNYGIDERAEVALLSRNIKLTSLAGQTSDANNFIGGHLVAMVTGATAPTLTLVGVEIEKFGQGLVGRYPVHLHKLPSGSPVLVQDVSVHHSYNKCYVVHGTGNANFYNNVCVRTVGQGVYLEDGAFITKNQFMRNLIAGTMAAQTTYTYPQQNGSTYWDGDNLLFSHWPAGSISNATNASPIVVSSSAVPANGSQVTISGVQGNTAANGTWTVTNATAGTFVLASTGNGPYASGGTFQISGSITSTTATNPIVVSSSTVPANGSKVTISGTGTNADGTWPVTSANPSAGTFALQGSNGTGTFSPPAWSTGGLNAITSMSKDSVTGLIIINTQSATVAGTQVTISNTNTQADGTWTATNVGSTSFELANSQSVSNYKNYSCCNGKWSASGTITNATNATPIVVSSSTVPANGSQVTIAGVQGNTAANGTWTVMNANAAAGTFALQSSNGSGNFSSATWQVSGTVTNATNATPIVISSSTVPANGSQVAISGVQGNTAANGTWTVTNANATAGTFALASTGNGPYASGGTWQSPQASPNWYTVNNIPDTSNSGLNLSPVDSTFPGGFWITNLGNTFVNNSVAGCQARGRGYWLLSQINASDPNVQYGYPEFTGNRVHGCLNGIDDDDVSGNTQGSLPTLTGTAYFAPVLLLNDNTVTRSRKMGLWLRSIYTALHNDRFATNLHGFSLLVGGGPEGTFPGYWGLVHQSVIAGMTRNNVERYPACPQTGNNWQQECTDVQLSGGVSNFGDYPMPNMNVLGYSYYDGPARIEHNRFVNFRFDPTGMHPNDPAARLLTKTDIQNINAYDPLGQLEGAPSIQGTVTTLFNGYAGDAATGWQQSNAQSVPPTQYIRDSIWDNVDFKHQVYTDDVNLGPLNDGDKTTVILDKDSQLSGLRVVNANGQPVRDVVPISLNNLDYYATDYTIDQPHARGPNNFRASALMSPHRYATVNIESVTNPASGAHLEIKRDMPAYGDTTYPSLFLYGRGGEPIYEPFVMDRMGYTVYGKTGIEHSNPKGAPFQSQLLFSYTDPAVHKGGDFFISRIAVYQPVTDPSTINVYRIRRQWGGQNYSYQYPPNFNGPGSQTTSCDNVFNQNQGSAATKWSDCRARATNQSPYNAAPYTNLGYPYGITLQPATNWTSFEQSYQKLLAGTTTVTDFIKNQTFYYDPTTSMLYFYMIEDQPVQQLPAPYGTCGGGATQYAANVAKTQHIKNFSDQHSVKAALDAACLAGGGTWQPSNPTTSITNVSLNTPIVITSATVPPPGTKVTIAQTNTPADGSWSVTILDATHFSLNDSTGSGTYTSGGTWAPLYPITDATNASPIVITTSSPVPANGTQVTISGVQGNTAANGTWTVTNTNTAAGTFALTSQSGSNSTGNGTFTKYEPQPIDLFICGQIGCAAYLVDFAAMPITGATNAKPIVITTSSPVPSNGVQVTISGVQGNTAANGVWTVINSNASAGTFALQGSNGTNSGTYQTKTGTWDNPNGPALPSPSCSPCVPAHPISRTGYDQVNQYQLVYGTSTQQPNGLPVSRNPATGNTAPPADGTPLIGVMAPIDGTPPPAGDQVTYAFYPLGGSTTPVTQNFPYRCVTTPPWSAVNARGTYPPSGGFAFPLHDSVCEWVMPNPIANVTSSGGTTTITSTSTNTANTLTLPSAGAQVLISGVQGLTGVNGTWSTTSPTANTFSISATGGGAYTAGSGTWQLLNPIASVASTSSTVTITVQPGAPVPGTGALVALPGLSGCTLAPPGPWTVATATPSTTAAGGSFSFNVSSSSGTCAQNNVAWQLQPPQ